LHQARVVDTGGRHVGDVPAIELVTVGQRRGLGVAGGGPKRFVLEVDRAASTVVVGDGSDLLRDVTSVSAVTWIDGPVDGDVVVQCSAHGDARPAVLAMAGDAVEVRWASPQRRVAPGQSVVFYDPSDRYVLGGGVAD
jgi:tRNA-specific 2-thiouridylase